MPPKKGKAPAKAAVEEEPEQEEREEADEPEGPAGEPAGVGKVFELTLNEADRRGFCAFFATLPAGDGVLRLFDRRDFYSVHGPAAAWVAEAYYRTPTVVKLLGAGPGALPGVTLNRGLFDQVVRDVLLHGAGARAAPYPLAAVEVLEDRGKGQGWVRARGATPGRLGDFEDELSRGPGGRDAPDGGDLACGVLAAVRLLPAPGGGGGRVVGVACLDAGARRLACCEFPDDDPSFSSLETVLAQMGAREVVLAAAKPGSAAEAAGKPERSRLAEAVRRAGAHPADLPASAFSAADAERALRRLLVASQPVEGHAALLGRPAAAAALGGLLRYAELEAAEAASAAAAAGGGAAAPRPPRYTLAHHDTRVLVRLDGAALRALHVLREPRGAGGGAAAGGAGGGGGHRGGFSLQGLLDRCRSAMGRRLLARWLRQPLARAADAEARLDVTAAFAADGALRDGLRGGPLRRVPDVERLARKVDARRATLTDVVKLYQACLELPAVADALEAAEAEAAAAAGGCGAAGGPGPLTARFAAPLRAAHSGPGGLLRFIGLVEEAVDVDLLPDEVAINPNYDDGLAELAARRAACTARLARLHADAAAAAGLSADKQLKLEHSGQHGWHLRCSKAQEASSRAALQRAGLATLEARRDGVKLTSAALRAASEARGGVEREYGAAQRALVGRVVEVAATYVEPLLEAAHLLAQLDVLASFGDVAATSPAPYCRPALHEPGAAPGGGRDVIRLAGCRHPCVEANSEAEFVPNDARLERGSSWFTIVTGPNMGGKSTFLRQVGVCVLMAQCGSFVPCDSATITVRDAIFCRVGAGDCTVRGISTFMAEMLETAAILRSAGPGSLVIIDELGRGTSTSDGFGLAWAIAAHVSASLRSAALFATHFAELTRLRGGDGVANRHVGAHADPATGRLTMLYALRDGPCDQSFGIHCAEAAHFPPEVLADARRRAARLEAEAAAAAAAGGGGRLERLLAGGGCGADGGEGAEEGGGGDGPNAAAAAPRPAKRPRAEAAAADGGADAAAEAARVFLSALAGCGGGGGGGAVGPEGERAAAAALAELEAKAAANPALARMLAAA